MNYMTTSSVVLNFDDIIPIMNTPIDSEKIDIILTTILRKGNVACEQFIKTIKHYSILDLTSSKNQRKTMMLMFLAGSTLKITTKILQKKGLRQLHIDDMNGERRLTFPIKLALKLSRMDILKKIDNVAALFEFLEDEAHVNKETSQKLSSKDVEIQKQYIVYALSNCTDDELRTALQKSKDNEKCKKLSTSVFRDGNV
ncbi:unnamed protein product [Mytilus edulis]|uniref:Uncharacterized protein n=1 Tax=Mytilus edulis TaxID=6550 RepID=A0A8S3QHK5_MYTED|nr:unnamed protein product [Mytilus edulis]